METGKDPARAGLRIPALFSLRQTLDCGQAFRWEETAPDCWEGVAGERALRLREEDGTLWLSCGREEYEGFWRRYFDLEEDYAPRLESLARLSPVLAEAVRLYPGIRILRQDPWEALCSFLLSQNNNIPRIKGIISRLCALLGAPIPGTSRYSFPRPEALLRGEPEALAPLRAGYRASYLLDAAEKVASGAVDLREIAKAPAARGRELLLTIRGVGPKVAECVLLYGFHKTECFPVDVWMRRAMKTLLPGRSPLEFGENAGLAQQLLFHYSRMHPALFSG